MHSLDKNSKEFRQPVLEEIAALCNWLDEQALPLWLNDGFDVDLGLFYERLDMQGKPIKELDRRLLVQCRQIAVYAQATLRGRLDVKDKILKIFERVCELYCVPHKKGHWRFSVTSRGTPQNEKLDSYTLTFMIFALAWLYRLEPSSHYLGYADDIFSVLDGPLSAQAGGIILGLPEMESTISQNPNMHLFEACLALYEAGGRPQDLDRAERLAELFKLKIFDHEHQALPEKHKLGWQIWEPSQNWFEPGHHFEWAWLLRQLERLGGRDYSDLIARLLEPAIESGLDHNSVVVERIGIQRNFRIDSSRNWGTCEYIKCSSNEYQEAYWRNDLDGARLWALRTLEGMRALKNVFLSPSKQGLWYDHLDHNYNCLTNYSPASSFYHIGFAIAEAEKVFTRVVPRKISFSSQKREALFLDRDGVINVDIGFAHRPEQIIFLPGIFELVRSANDQGHHVVVVTNQSGVARSHYSENDVIILHEWMAEQFFQQNAVVAAFYHCPYLVDATSLNYNRYDHFDRKPQSGMLKRGALEWNIDLHKSFMIGDKQSDRLSASNVGVSSIIIQGNHNFSLNYSNIKII